MDARIIATGVSEMSLRWTGSIETDGQLTFALIWAPKLADSTEGMESVSTLTTFAVQLPGVVPAR